MRAFVRPLLIAAAMAGALVTAVAPAGAASCVTLDRGHVDVVGVAYEDGALHLHVHDEESDTEYAPQDVKLAVRPEALTAVPDDPAYAFLGTPGAPVWILPQSQNPDLLWAGLGAEEVEPGDLRDDSVEVRFRVLSAPGDLAIFTEDAFGAPEQVLVDTGDASPDVVTLSAGSHVHADWAFEKPGHYWLVVDASARRAVDGTRVATEPALYHFVVGS
ncbi:choice-of-anchor M domain-containing protein [Yinghuangia sp. ASG 101]|uniref:choice-of-anchor M domain-containing protein n=1 Tax=Yinghuangia sp. ASG 101 TaxID=2896848 RepID=UPI001E30566C|nr:choice-of-anchor M domain-containing protein [Yinghuangia sp. ASG 101]UGQ13943.1 choice-of-anchor M domain-containing protein [Yinghuangia sp. ASG 101]